MDEGSIERLELLNGEEVTPAHLAQLDRAIVRNASMRGVGVLTTKYPWGVHHSYRAAGGTGTSLIFLPDATATPDGVFVTWQLGYIAGRIPTVDGQPIASLEEGAVIPPFLIQPAAFNEFGKSFVYFRVTLVETTFEIDTIEPFASAEELSDNRLHGHRLACVVSLTGDVWRAIYTNQLYTAAKGRGSGNITHFFASDF